METLPWLGILVLSWGLVRILGGYWMHTHPKPGQEVFDPRGWRLVAFLPLLLLLMIVFEPADWGQGRFGRAIDSVLYWLFTVIIVVVGYFLITNDI